MGFGMEIGGEGSEVILRNPSDHGNANSVAKTEQGLIERRFDAKLIGTHKPGAFTGSEETNGETSLPRDK